MDNVTIIIPARQFDNILSNTLSEIRKLYKQTPLILVLDNLEGSENFENVCILKSTSNNMSAKRNQGVQSSKTNYIAFIDSDAYPLENWLENGIAFLEEHKDYSAVTGMQYNAKEDNTEQKLLRLIRFSPVFTRKGWTRINDINSVDCDVNEFMTSNVIIRKNDFLSAGGFDENIYLAEDNEFSERFVNCGNKIRFKKDVAVYHRESPLFPYLRKVFCQGYYYSNILVNNSYPKSCREYFRKKAISNIFPLICAVLYFICLTVSYVKNKYFLELLVIPCLILLLILYVSFKEVKKYNYGCIKNTFRLFYYSLLFVIFYITGSFLGILNIPVKDVYSLYKHY